MSLTIKSCDADKCPSGCTEHIPITLDIGKKFLSAIYHCKNWMQKGVPYFQILPAGERNAELFAKTFEELNISFTKSVKDGKIQGFASKAMTADYETTLKTLEKFCETFNRIKTTGNADNKVKAGDFLDSVSFEIPGKAKAPSTDSKISIIPNPENAFAYNQWFSLEKHNKRKDCLVLKDNEGLLLGYWNVIGENIQFITDQPRQFNALAIAKVISKFFGKENMGLSAQENHQGKWSLFIPASTFTKVCKNRDLIVRDTMYSLYKFVSLILDELTADVFCGQSSNEQEDYDESGSEYEEVYESDAEATSFKFVPPPMESSWGNSPVPGAAEIEKDNAIVTSASIVKANSLPKPTPRVAPVTAPKPASAFKKVVAAVEAVVASEPVPTTRALLVNAKKDAETNTLQNDVEQNTKHFPNYKEMLIELTEKTGLVNSFDNHRFLADSLMNPNNTPTDVREILKLLVGLNAVCIQKESMNFSLMREIASLN